METAEVIVAGGGIIGLSSALELARHGFRVRVLEKGRAMSEASWAAAGMLSPHDPAHPPELAKLAELSIRLYPEYLSTVEGLSGRSVRLRTQAAISTEDEDGTSVAMSAQEAQRRIPGLATEGRSFHWVEEMSLDPRDLCAALPLAVSRGRGGSARRHGSACSAEPGGFRRDHDPEGDSERRRFRELLRGMGGGDSAFGAGTSTCCRGRAVEGTDLYCPHGASARSAYVLRSPEVYLVPRGGGNIVVGATVERVGFDRRVDPLTIQRLQGQAAELWPPIASAPVVESWTGLRPGTSDGLPMIGSAGRPRCWVATGHFRNGILLAPATGLIVRQLLQGSPPAVGLEAFAPGRPSK